MSQIVADLYLSPDYAHLPRMGLVGFPGVPFPTGKGKGGGSSQRDGVKRLTPHVDLFLKLLEGGELDFRKVRRQTLHSVTK